MARRPYTPPTDADRERQRRYYARNATAVKARKRAERNAKLSERQRVARAYKARHKEECLASFRAYYADNADAMRARAREYAANNLARRTCAENKRRARKAGACGDGLTPEQWADMVLAFGGRCAYCAALSDKLTQDHVTPLSRGGAHDASNIVPACRSCNTRKHAIPLILWLARGGVRVRQA